MILIGTDEGIYRWYEGCGWPVFHSLQHHAIVGMAAPGAGVLAALDRSGLVFESIDNGQSWRAIPLAEGSSNPSAIAIGGDPASILLATRVGGLHRRAVGAPVPKSPEDPSQAPRGFAAPLLRHAKTLTQTATALVSPNRKPAHVDLKTARLAGWSRLNPVSAGLKKDTAEIRAVAIGEGAPAAWFAAPRGKGLWRSNDSGTTWQPCPGLPSEVYAIRTTAKQPGSVYVGTSEGCFVSADGGQTWENRSAGLERGRFVSALELKPGSPDTLLAGVGPFPPEQAGVSPIDGAGYALYESSNGGKSWLHVKRGHPELLETDAIADIRYDPAAPDNVIVAQTSGELWVSRNDGAYWAPLARQIHKARVLCAAI